ncbi:MAG: FecR domain-containing protein [Saprospiraceae bacterium]|nr:FecR domain-containing protein [Saprospiraceae bacterium]
MEKSKIHSIITNCILGEASPEEVILLDQWRKESPQNEDLYQEYSSIWNASENYTSQDFKPNAQSAYQKHLDLLASENNNEQVRSLSVENTAEIRPKVHKAKILTLRRLSSIAALFVLVFGAYFVFNVMNTTTISGTSGVTFVSLEDGSSIWLDDGSTISYTSGFGTTHRNIDLEGKAFFDVERNENVAFNITSDQLNVSVLGTSFTVDTKSGNNSVAVKSGKVEVTVNNKKITLQEDDKVSFENNEFISSKLSKNDVLWRNSDLSFDNARLDQVIADINLYHNNKIILKSNLDQVDCPFTSKSLASTSFNNIIEILKITYDLEKAESPIDGTVTLTIDECK